MSKEFFDFLNTGSEPVPDQVNRTVLNEVQHKLNPPMKQVLAKFFIAQAFSGILTLAICPQFGFGPLGGGHGIAHYFMRYGTSACAAFCGAFFLGVSVFAASWVLSRDELRKLLRYRLWIVTALGVVYLLGLMGLGAILELPTLFKGLGPLSVWMLAGWASAALLLEAEKKWRLSSA